MNLDGSDNDANYDIGNNDEDGEEPVSEQAMKHMKALKNILKSCQKCGPEVLYSSDQVFGHASPLLKMNSSQQGVTGHLGLWTPWQLEQKNTPSEMVKKRLKNT